MKKAILKAGVLCLKIAYAPMKLCSVKNRIAFLSRQSASPSLDVRKLTKYLAEYHPELDVKVLVRMLDESAVGALRYGGHMLRQMHALATSKVVVVDGYNIAACLLDHKPQTKVLQIWHALAAIKKFGYQTLDKPAGHSSTVAEIMQMHRRYDGVLCPSEETGRAFCKGMNLNESQLVYMGLPRIDEILREDGEFAKRIREEYGIGPNQKIALYVPTFRKGEKVRVSDLAEALDREAFALVVRLHPVYEQDGEIPDGVINGSKYSSYDLLKACDAVITDYSALGVEAALTGKPVYFYLYDYEEYKEQVGLNVDPMEEMGQAAAVDAKALAQMMKEEYDFEALKRFRDKYISVDTDDCTKRLGEYLVSLMK